MYCSACIVTSIRDHHCSSRAIRACASFDRYLVNVGISKLSQSSGILITSHHDILHPQLAHNYNPHHRPHYTRSKPRAREHHQLEEGGEHHKFIEIGKDSEVSVHNSPGSTISRNILLHSKRRAKMTKYRDQSI